MRRLKFLLRPGWFALVIAVIVFAGACFWLLSPWQFGRNAQRQEENSTIITAVHSSPIPIEQLLPGDSGPSTDQEWREVTMNGKYLPADEVVVRLREIDSCDDCDPSPVYEIVTPFQLTNGSIVLVDRGYVPPSDSQVPSYPAPPTGQVSLIARVHPNEPDSRHAPLVENGHREVYDINSAVISQDIGLRLRTGYFALINNQPGVLGVLPLPQQDSGPFLSYAWQWIAFGAMAIFGLGYFTWRELKPGGALTPEGRLRRQTEKIEKTTETDSGSSKKLRGRHAIAQLIAEDEEHERAELTMKN